jgi:protein gp37
VKDSKIQWCHHTFNPWWGCAKVSPGCKHCYAETFAKRVGQRVWGEDVPRRTFGDKHFDELLKWNREAETAGERRRVFCASMADVFEAHPVAERERPRLWSYVDRTPWLDYLLLTKRPENAFAMAPWGLRWPGNVWLGTTVEDRERLGRLDSLRTVPAFCRFVSFEPLLEDLGAVDFTGIDWAIVGGESGPGARPFDLAWARSLVEQCRSAGVAPFVKQLGANPLMEPGPITVHLEDPKGGDPAEWPEDLRAREFPAFA